MRKSFTLIELLIVIVIIGILAAALVPRMLAVQDKARDTKRKADLQQVVNWVMLYAADNWLFPYWRGTQWDCANYQAFPTCAMNSTQTVRMTEISGYISATPKDPTNRVNANSSIYTSVWHRVTWYVYAYQAVNSRKGFSLTTRLEHNTDPDGCRAQAYRYFAPTAGGTWTACAVTLPDIYVVNGGAIQ